MKRAVFAVSLAGLLLGCQAEEAPLSPRFHMRNVSARRYTVVPMIRHGRKREQVNPPLVLPDTGKGMVSYGFFTNPQPGDHYLLSIQDRNGFEVLELKFDGTVLRSALKTSVDVTIDKHAALVKLGSRRQKFLLLPPDPKGSPSKTGS